ncbi:3'-5' exonuclease [Streptomyces subrutilus]|uniref:Exonuclease domain-containing protein n=1 Tax=Streptomyces subrutilus TaxID=36818 RepID=A0A1E5NXL8_9ACTN|nr:3'-5' exonuclease [Streptomyces subrutilus]OEJ20948.1 hypothetical protein BGK67_35110 [Streptomyces subrutilus]
MTVIDPTKLDDLFTREIDEQEVRFVRPGDTDRPDWCAYEGDRFLGMLYAESATGETLWRLGSTTEKHQHLDDAVRALRRPSSWPSERAQVSNWARRLLGDPSLVAVDIETTGLGEAWAVQIAATDRSGRVIFNELVNPLAEIDPEAVAIHKITPDRAATAATFGTLLPALTEALQGRTCVAYKVDFDRGCLERELRRHYGSQAPAEQWAAGLPVGRRTGAVRRVARAVVGQARPVPRPEVGRSARSCRGLPLPAGQDRADGVRRVSQPANPEVQMAEKPLTAAEIQRRMDHAAHTYDQGDGRTAARLYDQLGKDVQAQYGRFDSRAIDAFEEMARVIHKG